MNLLVDALATYRLTRLVTTDTITQPLRDRVFAETGRIRGKHARPSAVAEKVEYLITCPWCVSVYAGGAVALLRVSSNKAASALLYAGALAGAVSLLHDLAGDRIAASAPTTTGAPGW